MRALFQPVDDVVIWRNSLCKFRGILHAKVWFHSTWHNILLYNKYVYFQYNIMVHSHTLLSFQSLYQARKASDNTCVLWVSIICFGLHEFRSFLTYVISILWYTCMWSSPSRVEGTMTFWLQPTPRTQARHPAWLSDWYIYCI